MQLGKIGGGKAARRGHAHGQGVAHGQRGGGRGGGRQPVRAGFAGYADIEHGLCIAPQGGGRLSGQRDELQAQALDPGQQFQQFFGFSAVGKRDHHVAGGQRAEIAVQRLGRMQIQRRHAGGVERGRDLARDQTAFAQAGDHHPAPAFEDQAHRCGKPLLQAAFQRRHGFGLDPQHVPRHRKCGLGFVRFRHLPDYSRSMGKLLLTGSAPDLSLPEN